MHNIATDIPKFDDHHALRHKLAPDGREALAHMLVLPEHGIAGFIYPSLRGNGTAKVRTTLFGPGLGEEIHEEMEGPAPEGIDFDNWDFGPLRMAVLAPHQTIELAWNGDRIQFEGKCEAAYPVYAFSSHPTGMPKYYGDDRTEQHYRVVGKLTVDGREFPVDGWLFHDHSWGARVWGLNQHYKWFHAATAQSSVHFFEMMSFGRRSLQGYLAKDGRMTHISDVKYDFKYDDDMMHKSISVEVIDMEGRTAKLDCTAIANIQLHFDTETLLNEAATTVEIDGVPGTGWCEFCWNKNYHTFARQYVSQYA